MRLFGYPKEPVVYGSAEECARCEERPARYVVLDPEAEVIGDACMLCSDCLQEWRELFAGIGGVFVVGEVTG